MTVLALGGGLLGWHLYLDRTEYRPSAVSLSHGECEGTLGDPGIAAMLGHTPRVFVETGLHIPDRGIKPSLRCTVEGQGGRTLYALAVSVDRPTDLEDGQATFNCTLKGKAEPYRASLRVGRLPQADTPARVRADELVTGFAARAAEKLGCANGAESLTVR
ncbi:hypothetical protein [Kitasatospora sp. NPDC058190]|uniref:hypothetical protein n=1 Tax=Kitasatospora sp. NPDC058190 TaxID=3346371 RepID=UPI0036DCC448